MRFFYADTFHSIFSSLFVSLSCFYSTYFILFYGMHKCLFFLSSSISRSFFVSQRDSRKKTVLNCFIFFFAKAVLKIIIIKKNNTARAYTKCGKYTLLIVQMLTSIFIKYICFAATASKPILYISFGDAEVKG